MKNIFIFTTIVWLRLASSTVNATTNDSSTSLTSFIAFDEELRCLEQLPLNELLRMRKTLRMISNTTDAIEIPSTIKTIAARTESLDFDSNENENNDAPSARFVANNDVILRDRKFGFNGLFITPSPFIGGVNNQQKTGYGGGGHSSGGWEDEKPTKVQKVLHFSITALAFLAFAGYLLCMIVQAIKSKGTTYFHPAMTMPMTMMMESDQIVNTNNHHHNQHLLLHHSKPHRPPRFRRHTMRRKIDDVNGNGEPTPEELYRILIYTAENYVQFQSIFS